MPKILEFDPRGEEMLIEDPYAQHNLMYEAPGDSGDRQVLLAKEVCQLRKDLRYFMREFGKYIDSHMSRSEDLPGYVEDLPSFHDLRNSVSQ